MKRRFTKYPSGYVRAGEDITSEQTSTGMTSEQSAIVEKLGKPLSTIITDSFIGRMEAYTTNLEHYYDGRISGMAAILAYDNKITSDEYYVLLER